jgi:hypothetical protein
VIPAHRQRNYLQSGLYVIIAGICAAILLDRLLDYAEAAEKMAMEATLSRLHSALYTRMAYFVLRNEQAPIDALPNLSPFAATDSTAKNYLGEFDGVPESAAGGHWLFDRVRSELVYLPNIRRHLEFGDPQPDPPALRFKVQVLREPQAGYRGVSLRPVAAYQWQPLP